MLLGSGCLSDEPLAPGPSPPVMGNMEAASNTTSLPPDASLSQQSFHTTMKIANATPLDLPPDLHQALIGMHEVGCPELWASPESPCTCPSFSCKYLVPSGGFATVSSNLSLQQCALFRQTE